MTDARDRGPDFDMEAAAPGAAEPALPNVSGTWCGESRTRSSPPRGTVSRTPPSSHSPWRRFSYRVFATPMATRKYRL